MSKTKKNVLAIVLVAVLALGALLCWKMFAPEGTAGGKTITVEVVHGDETTKEFVIKTDSENLRGALDQEEGLVAGEEGQFGLFILTVDGETINSDNQEWWCVTKNGEQLMTGVEDTVIADGEHYEITFTVGYENF